MICQRTWCCTPTVRKLGKSGGPNLTMPSICENLCDTIQERLKSHLCLQVPRLHRRSLESHLRLQVLRLHRRSLESSLRLHALQHHRLSSEPSLRHALQLHLQQVLQLHRRTRKILVEDGVPVCTHTFCLSDTLTVLNSRRRKASSANEL